MLESLILRISMYETGKEEGVSFHLFLTFWMDIVWIKVL
jgi:hypothetical protein